MKRPAAVADEQDEAHDEEMGEAREAEETEQAQDEEENDDVTEEAETAVAMKKPARVLKKPASVPAETEENEVAEQTETVVRKKPAGVLKKPASVQAEDDEIEAVDEEEEADVQKKPAAKKARVTQDESLVLKKPAGLLKKPAAAEASAEPDENKSGVDVASRKKELKSMDASELKDLVLSKDLPSSNKSANVEAILAWEAKEREAASKRIANAKQITANFKKDLVAKGASELGELCQQKGLKKGGGKDEKVERLFAHATEAGEIARVIAASERDQRKEELSSMDRDSLYNLCTKKGIDPLNKEVMVDRILAHDSGK